MTTLSSPSGARRRGRSSAAIWGPLAIIAIYVVAALIGPALVGYDPNFTDTGNRLVRPLSQLADGSITLFGTDQVGQDIFAQVLQGARISMLVGFLTLLVAGTSGVLVGVVAGYFGGWLDSLLMRVADVQLSFPGILLAILVAAMLGQSVLNVIVVLSLAGWVTFARVTRGQALATRNAVFIDATRTLGASHWHIIRTGILPAAVAPLLVISALEMGAIILAEASLSFLGLGAPASSASWGVTIANGRDFLGTAWWISTIPGIFLALLVVACGLLGDALRDRFDPKLSGM
jgi:peptide/nickel transport system permease protein